MQFTLTFLRYCATSVSGRFVKIRHLACFRSIAIVLVEDGSVADPGFAQGEGGGGRFRVRKLPT